MLLMTTAAGGPGAVAPTGWIADDETFGARLALVRQRKGWNIAEAARTCGVNGESWRLWEQGRSPSRLTTIAMAIASAAGCDYLWLVHGPQRGGMRPTTGYTPDARVVARIGHDPNGQAHATTRRGATTRPVSQTRPLRRGSSRPETPVAI